MNETSARLKKAIQESGLTLRDIEKLSGVPHSAIQRYASGATDKIPIGRIECIAKALGIPTERILGWDTPSHPADSRFSKEDSDLAFALWGDSENIDEKDIEDVKRFAAFIKEKKQDK